MKKKPFTKIKNLCVRNPLLLYSWACARPCYLRMCVCVILTRSPHSARHKLFPLETHFFAFASDYQSLRSNIVHDSSLSLLLSGMCQQLFVLLQQFTSCRSNNLNIINVKRKREKRPEQLLSNECNMNEEWNGKRIIAN